MTFQRLNFGKGMQAKKLINTQNKLINSPQKLTKKKFASKINDKMLFDSHDV